jgi:hypothetical protein
MDEELEIVRGHQAEALLENELLNEALDAIAHRYSSAWMNTSLSENIVREEAYRMLAATREVRMLLTSFITTGKLATTAKETRQTQEDREQDMNNWDGSADSRQ